MHVTNDDTIIQTHSWGFRFPTEVFARRVLWLQTHGLQEDLLASGNLVNRISFHSSLWLFDIAKAHGIFTWMIHNNLQIENNDFPELYEIIRRYSKCRMLQVYPVSSFVQISQHGPFWSGHMLILYKLLYGQHKKWEPGLKRCHLLLGLTKLIRIQSEICVHFGVVIHAHEF